MVRGALSTADPNERFAMSSPLREQGRIRLRVWAGSFVVLVCVAILGLSGWGEWSARDAELRNAGVDMANLAQALAQHANDTFELTENVLTSTVRGLEIEGTGIEAVARLQTFIDRRKLGRGRIRGLFICDENGRWLVSSEAASLEGLDNSNSDYFRHHAQTDDHGMLIGRPIKSGSGGQWIITA